MGDLNWKWASFHEKRYSQLIRTSTGWMFMVDLCLNSCANVNLDSDRVRVKWKQSKFILIKRICSSKHEMVSVSINHSCFTVYITVLYVWVCFFACFTNIIATQYGCSFEFIEFAPICSTYMFASVKWVRMLFFI